MEVTYPDLFDKELVRDHYDRLSVYYRTFWGDHIHHGYWEDNESTGRAQMKLVERLATKARIPSGSRVLDVGCGIGGSACWIAKNLGASVLGGVVALCAWLAGSHLSLPQKNLVEQVCRGMLCPSLGAFDDHIGWLEQAGFFQIEGEDCTRQVERTWDYVVELLQTGPVQALLQTTDDRIRPFVNACADIRRAYAEDAIAYGMFTGRKL